MKNDTKIATRSLTADDDIKQKLAIVKSYFKDSWDLDLDQLRSIILRRSQEVLDKGLDIKNYKLND